MDGIVFDQAAAGAKQLDLLAFADGQNAGARREALAEVQKAEGRYHLISDLLLKNSQDFKELRGIGQKTDLRIECERATDEDLKVLSGVNHPGHPPNNVVSLGLKGTGVTDDGVLYLQHLTELEKLNLSYTSVTDEAVKAISKLQKLQTLDLTATDVTSKGVALLAQSPHLHTLSLDGEKDSFGSLSKFGALRQLNLQVEHFNLDPQIVRNIGDCKSLKAVDLYDPRDGIGSNRSDQKALIELSRRLPGIKVAGHWGNGYELAFRDGRLVW